MYVRKTSNLSLSVASGATIHCNKFDFNPYCRHYVILLHVVTQELRDQELQLSCGHTICNMWLPLVREEDDKLAGTDSCSIFFSLFLWNITSWSHRSTKMKEFRILWTGHIDLLNWKSVKCCEEQRYLFLYLYTFRPSLYSTVKIESRKECKALITDVFELSCSYTTTFSL